MFFFFTNSPTYIILFSFFLTGIWDYDSYWFTKGTYLGSLDVDFALWFAHLHVIEVRKRKVMKKWIEVCKTFFCLVIKEWEVNKYYNFSVVLCYNLYNEFAVFSTHQHFLWVFIISSFGAKDMCLYIPGDSIQKLATPQPASIMWTTLQT